MSDIQTTIETMQKNMGIKFVQEAKTIIRNGKVLKGEDKEKNFNTEIDEITYEVEEIYPLNYEQFAEEFPNLIESIEKVKGSAVMKLVDQNKVIDGWGVRTNVDNTIERIKANVEDKKEQKEAIALRNNTYDEIQRMKEEFEIEWCKDLFWKCYAIKEGKARWDYLCKQKGEAVAKSKIESIRKAGGLEFLKALQETIYPKE